MFHIILLGAAPGGIAELVRAAWDISGKSYIAACDGEAWLSDGFSGGADFLLLHTRDAGSLIKLHPSLVVMCGGGNGSLPHGLSGADESVVSAIFDSGDHTARRMLLGSGLSVISCGHGSKDTVTFASVEGEGPIVTIQRAFKGFSNNKIEEQDIHIKLPINQGCEYDVLAATAVCAMTGTLKGLMQNGP